MHVAPQISKTASLVFVLLECPLDKVVENAITFSPRVLAIPPIEVTSVSGNLFISSRQWNGIWNGKD